jgi:hypothetical protein
VNPPPGYIVPDFPSLYKPDLLTSFSKQSEGYFLYYAEGASSLSIEAEKKANNSCNLSCFVDIFHFTLYWHLIFHVLIFGATGTWFTFVALFSPTSSVGIRLPASAHRRASTDLRTNTEIAEEGAVDVDRHNMNHIPSDRRGSASDNDAAKVGIRERMRRGLSNREVNGPGSRPGSSPAVRKNAGNRKMDDRKSRSRRSSSADGLKIMDFAEDPEDIPLQPTMSGKSIPPLQHPKPRRARTRARISKSNADSGQSSDLETHPTAAFAGTEVHAKHPAPLRSPRRMDSPDLDDLALDRPISHTDVPLPNQSQFSLPREGHFESAQPVSLTKTRTVSVVEPTLPNNNDNRASFSSSRNPLHSLKMYWSNSTGMTESKVRTYQPGRRRAPKHSRRPAPIWLAALPLPVFVFWGIFSALIMATIIGFTLSAVYNTAGFEMST